MCLPLSLPLPLLLLLVCTRNVYGGGKKREGKGLACLIVFYIWVLVTVVELRGRAEHRRVVLPPVAQQRMESLLLVSLDVA